MPQDTKRTYTAEALETAVDYLSAYLMRVRAIAQRMRDEQVPQITITMEAAARRAAADVKRWSRSVEDGFDRHLLVDDLKGNTNPKPRRRGRNEAE